MSKRSCNIIFVSDLVNKRYSAQTIRFFLIYCGYRERLNFTFAAVDKTKSKLESIISRAKLHEKSVSGTIMPSLIESFRACMDEDLNTKSVIDALHHELIRIDESIQNRSPPNAKQTDC